MKSLRPRTAARPLLIAFAAVVFTLTSGSFVHAQRLPPGSGRDLSANERDALARELEAKRKPESAKRDPSAIMAEINEDFERLRAINEGFKQTAASDTAPDHGAITQQAAEVKKRATRLDANLSGLPKSEKGEKRPKYTAPADDAQMKASLKTLNEVLTSFLTNPVFSDIGTLDPQLVTKARRDLENTLTLSEVVRKGAEKLAKH